MTPEEHAAIIAERRARAAVALPEPDPAHVKAQTKRQVRAADAALQALGVEIHIDAASGYGLLIKVAGEVVVSGDGGQPRRVADGLMRLGMTNEQ